MANADPSPSPDFSPLAISQDLTPLPQSKAAGTISLDFSGLLAMPLLVHEDVTSGCGGQLWPAGMVLARHMLRYQRGSRARMLELGAGAGVVGLSIAKACPDSVVCITDQAGMLSLMEQNIALNQLEGQVKARILNWGETLTKEIVDFKPEIVLAADCVYFEPSFPLLLKTLQDLMALESSPRIYLCFKKRRRADMHFLKSARKLFTVSEIEDEDGPHFTREGLFLLLLTRQ